MPITHTDGNEYFSKTELEDKIKDRVRGEQERAQQAVANATTWEQKARAAEPELAKVTTLAAELDTWKSKATQLETRFTAATEHGITDGETLEALEEAHKKAMGRVTDPAAKVSFQDYLKTVKADPTLLPKYLQGVFAGAGNAASGAPPRTEPAKTEQPARPPWASSSTGTQRIDPGSTPTGVTQIRAAKTLEDLAVLSAARRR